MDLGLFVPAPVGRKLRKVNVSSACTYLHKLIFHRSKDGNVQAKGEGRRAKFEATHEVSKER